MPRLPRSVPEARHRVQQAMRSWGEPDDRVETAALVVTELVANAVEHTTGRRIRCRLLRTPGRVRICVWNRRLRHGQPLPRPRDPAVPHTRHAAARPERHRAAGDGSHGPGAHDGTEGPGPVAATVPEGMDGHEGFSLTSVAEDGRGLMLVDALASRWGTRTSMSGRLVWADI
ncbi:MULTISPECIES: ATP-binding protein [unclassified Streptomyces]|uniref:ATP-binding protein n=1 Tax=unclassified Streptomyces TaxID=2593676 RepID=UPI00093C2F82|nr:ATP-binding protein [Streptomyces sp. CB02058]